MQAGDNFFVAADEAAYMHMRPWSSPEPGAPWDKRRYHAYIVREAGSLRVSPLDEYPDHDFEKHAEY